MNVDVRYFAVLRERRGIDRERISTSSPTWETLYAELSARHGLDLSPNLVRFAVNGEFVASDAPVFDGAEVALIPPVAGG